MRKFIQELIWGPGRMRRLEDRIEKLEKQVAELQDKVLYEDGWVGWPMVKSNQIPMRDAVKAIYDHLGLIARWTTATERKVVASDPDKVWINAPRMPKKEKVQK